jgi:hypothetical protein
MSSEISTNAASAEAPTHRESLQPWQLFTLAGLIGATVVVFMSRGQSPAAIILLSTSIFAAAFIGLAALRTFLPLTGAVQDIGPDMVGGRTRAALEREKTLALRSIKELEFDRGMGKVSEKDFAEMSARLRARAARLMRQLDAGSVYREQIEREVEKRLARSAARPSTGSGRHDQVEGRSGSVACLSCKTPNDPDARFCKSCGSRLEGA